jgi:hypothetical protein
MTGTTVDERIPNTVINACTCGTNASAFDLLAVLAIATFYNEKLFVEPKAVIKHFCFRADEKHGHIGCMTSAVQSDMSWVEAQ